jgi:KTSC domain
MVRAFTALLLGLLASPITSETVDVRGRGGVDLGTFECRDINRSTIVQRVCYEAAHSTLVVAAGGVHDQYCGVPTETYAAFMVAPSMGLFLNRNIRALADNRYRCDGQDFARGQPAR